MEPIDEINQTHPCDKRAGYGTKGCDCDGSLTTDTTKVKCLFFGRGASMRECRKCSHQIQYARILANKK